MLESTNFDLALAIELDKQITVKFVYNPIKFDLDLLQRVMKGYQKILSEILKHTRQKLSEIEIISKEEKQRILFDFNQTDTDYPKVKTITQLFEEVVEKNPKQIALSYHDQSWTYGQLNAKANQLARTLQKKNVLPEQIIALIINRSFEMVVGILGVLKAGGAYLPIDPVHPVDRIAYILHDSQTKTILSHSNLLDTIPKDFSGEVIELNLVEAYQDDSSNIGSVVNSENLAYVIYTSGTTGRPKGTLISHYNVNRLVKNTNYLQIKPHDRLLQISNYVFDGSVFDLFAALLNGATLVLVAKETISNISQLATLIHKEKITQFLITTALFNVLIEANKVGQLFKSVKKIYFGGERASSIHVRKAFKSLGADRLVNLYGPTEGTVVTAYYPINQIKDISTNIPIGRPISNTKVYVLSFDNQLQPIGALGELCISGDGQARGYLHQANLSEEKFIDHEKLGVRLYKTGDLVRWLPDGNLEFWGRIDQQVKIRGFRIELAEIEAQLLSCTQIKGAVVGLVDSQNSRDLVAYFVSEQELSAEKLSSYLEERLPYYMIPTAFRQLSHLPLTSNGKIDREALPKVMLRSKQNYRKPRNQIEEKLVKIWSDVLGQSQVGIDDNYFNLGGHSISAMLLVAKVYKELGVELPVSEVFKRPTIAGISEYIMSLNQIVYTAIDKVIDEEAYYQTSSAQKRVYLLQTFDLSSTKYNISSVYKIEGRLDLAKVEKGFSELVKRHQILRTSFERMDDQIVQIVNTDLSVQVELIKKTDDKLANIIKRFVRPFDLSKVPLFRIGVFNKSEKEAILLFDIHHIIFDGTSMEILVKEFSSLYADQKLTATDVQYKDFVAWQNKQLKTDRIKEQKKYWTDRLSGQLPVLNLPTDHVTTFNATRDAFAGDQITKTLNSGLSQALHRLVKETESTLYMVLLAGINILFAKYTGQDDIIIGSPIAGRSHGDLEKVIGMFVNTLIMRNQPQGNKTFRDFLQEVKSNALKAYENQDYQFEELVSQLDLPRDLEQNPIFDIMFAVHNFDQRVIRIGNLVLRPYRYYNRTAKFALTILCNFEEDSPANISLNFEYQVKLFKRETVQRMICHFVNILEAITANPEVYLAEIDLLIKAEREQILSQFNDTYTDYPRDKTIHKIFETEVIRRPSQTAAVFRDESVTYRELNSQANRLARTLREKGVLPNQIVGIFFQRSLKMIIGILAILKAGGAYLPISPEYPEKRVKYMLKDSELKLLLTQSELIDSINFSVEKIDLDDQAIYATRGENLTELNQASDLAIVIYTSGTTGKPKGTLISHVNVNRLVKNTNYLQIEENDRLMQLATYVFDGSVFEIFATLLNGAALVLVPQEISSNISMLSNFIYDEKITQFFITTALFNVLIEENGERCRKLFQRIKKIYFGGEKASSIHVQKAFKYLGADRLVNGYGPTENTVFTACYLVNQIEEQSPNIPIGKPISNTQVFVLNSDLQLQPIGVWGEMYIAGDGLAQGYLRRAELTAEKFVYHSKLGQRLYKTGDLVRWMTDGNLEFFGRIDQQVKIRGFRIELAEIEVQVLSLPQIKEVAVVDVFDKSANPYLVVYFVSEQKLSVEELRAYLEERLPNYMIPSYFIQLDKLPITMNGKVDRRRLPKLEDNLISITKNDLPKNPIEKKLVEIFQDVLKLKQVGINDSYFQLGGDSLKAMILTSRIHQEWNVEIPLREIFQRSSIKMISRYLQRATESEYVGIERVTESMVGVANSPGCYVVSPAQKRMYILQQFDLESTSYNMPSVFTLEGKLDLKKMKRAFQQLIRRHETLRTSFARVGQEIVQRVNLDREVFFEVESLTPMKTIKQLINEFIRPFDLSKAPLFRVGIFKITPVKHLLIFDMHHIISDGLSMGIFVREFSRLYAGQKLAELKIQYKDFTAWQRKRLNSEIMKAQEEYWIQLFSDQVPILNLPTDYTRPVVHNFQGAAFSYTFDQKLSDNLQQFVKDRNSTLYMVLLSGIYVLLAKYSGQKDIIIGSPIAGRPHAELDHIIGVFVNTLAMRNKPAGEKKFAQFLKEVRKNALKAYENQDYQFEELIDKLNLKRDLSRNPLFDVMFSMQNFRIGELQLENLTIKPYNYQNRTTKFDLSIFASVDTLNSGAQRISLNFQYDLRLFKKETIARMVTHLRNIFQIVISEPEISIKQIKLWTVEEKNQILDEFNQTYTDYPQEKTIQQIFEEQVLKYPERIAIISATGEKITYLMLNHQSNRLARTLRKKGVKPDCIVGLLVERSLLMMIGILGILKAGGAYLAIAPDYPRERMQYILSDSKTPIILTENKYLKKLAVTEEIINLQEDIVYDPLKENLEQVTSSKNLVYVIYTSGSTGRPKGVTIEHQSVVNTLCHLQKFYPLDVEDTILQATTYTFDAAAREIFWWFFNGSKCYLLEPAGEKDPRKIVEIINQEQITMVKFVPILMNEIFTVIREIGIDKVSSLKYLFVGGEGLSRQLVNKYFQLFATVASRPRFINLYGPSEATIHCSEYEINSPIASIYAPIGKPISNDQIYLLDEALQPVAIGVPGELYISGVGLAREYLNNPSLTLEKFIPNPITAQEKDAKKDRLRVYKTGDLARWLPDGNLEFLGRVDHQVKIRGYRIELGEVESQLRDYPTVMETVVIDRTADNQSRYLAAYIVAEKKLTSHELRKHLADKLPDYMIPTYFTQIDQLPLNKNGKIDRQALPKPAEVSKSNDYLAPSNEIEAKLAIIWAKILDQKIVGVNDNFFELGGHSLKATLLAATVHQELNIELPLRVVFQHPTIRELAVNLAEARESNFFSIEPIKESQDYPAEYPASAAQKRLYIQDQFSNVGISYNLSGAVIVEGNFQRDNFIQAIMKLIERHETLRTSFAMVNGEVVQRVWLDAECQISYFSGDESNQQEIFGKFFHPFDLSRAPLFRVGLVKITEQKQIIIFDMHHIISDGLSINTLVKEFFAFYQGQDLPKLRLQYKDFAVWQNKLLTTPKIAAQKEYWLKIFDLKGDGVPVLNMPTDYLRPAMQSFRGDQFDFQIDRELSSQIKRLAVDTSSTLFMVLLAVFNLLLAKYTGQEDFVVGSPIAGRRHVDVEKIIGMFVNMLALRNRPTSHKIFTEFLTEVKNSTVQAFDNQDYQFADLVEKLDLPRDLSRNPLFDVSFSLEEAKPFGLFKIDNLQMIPYPVPRKIAKFDLSLVAVEEGQRLHFAIEYCSDLFTKERIERFADHYCNLLLEITKQPAIRLKDVNILSKKEQKQLLDDFNATEMEYADKTLQQLFTEQVAKTPKSIALVSDTKQLTYHELNKQINQLAYHLRQEGVGRNQIVAIMAERSSAMIIGIFSILKASGAYLPIDPNYPDNRIRFMLDDSQAEILLTHHLTEQKAINSYGKRVIDLNDQTLYLTERDDLENINNPGDLVYVMYTSGTSGQPKGVMIEHKSVVNLTQYYQQRFHLDQTKNILHLSNISFDTSVVEIFPPLLSGATVYILEKELALDKQKFKQFVQSNQIHFAQFVPMTLQEILGQSKKLDFLETVIVGGEQLEDGLKDQILRLGYHLTNHYGPTEATVDSLIAECLPGRSTIGKPIANTRAYILDKDNCLTPIGVVGELCISGVGLARGYLNRDDLTKEKFMPNPVRAEERIYRTGDLASWQADGNIVFHGRIDNQIKVRGYRIELAEIETQLQRYPGINQAVVLERRDSTNNKYLCAYLVMDQELNPSAFSKHLAKNLPKYMIPTHYQQISQIPLTHHGKIDQKALLRLTGMILSEVAYAPPSNVFEAKLQVIWQRVLCVDKVGTKHNFFDLGGHSLKAIQIINSIYQEFNIQIGLQEMFSAVTIEQLAKLLQSKDTTINQQIEKLAKKEYYELSYNQKRLWIVSQLEPLSKAYNITGQMMIDDFVDEQIIVKVLEKLITRHESLQTHFKLVQGQMVQMIDTDADLQLQIFDLVNLSKKEQTLQHQIIYQNITDEPFEILESSLLRTALLKIAEQRFEIIFCMHHIISDGWSLEILQAEFYQLYSAYKKGKEAQLKPLAVQYKDFAAWQNRLLANPEKNKPAREYWLKKLKSGFPALNLPHDYCKASREGAAYRLVISDKVKDQLKKTAKQHQTSLFIVLVTVLKLFLAELTDQEMIGIGVPCSGRQQESLSNVIGFFVNTIVLINRVSSQTAFEEMLQIVHQDVLQALEFQAYPLELITGELQINYPEIQVFFNLLNLTDSHQQILENTDSYHLKQVQDVKFEITFYLKEYVNGIEVICSYRPNLYRPSTIEYIAEEYIRLMTKMVGCEDQNSQFDDDQVLIRG